MYFVLIKSEKKYNVYGSGADHLSSYKVTGAENCWTGFVTF